MDELKVWLKLLLRPLIVVIVLMVLAWVTACWRTQSLYVPEIEPRLILPVAVWVIFNPVYWFLFVILGGDDLWDATGKLLDRLPPGFETIRAKIRKYNDS